MGVLITQEEAQPDTALYDSELGTTNSADQSSQNFGSPVARDVFILPSIDWVLRCTYATRYYFNTLSTNIGWLFPCNFAFARLVVPCIQPLLDRVQEGCDIISYGDLAYEDTRLGPMERFNFIFKKKKKNAYVDVTYFARIPILLGYSLCSVYH